MGILDDLFGGADQSTTKQRTNIPNWMDRAGRDIYTDASKYFGKGYNPYDGQRVAGLTPDQLDAAQRVRDGMGIWQPFFEDAQKLTGEAAGYRAKDIDYTAIGDQDIQKYLNPYAKEVEDNAMANVERARLLATNGVADLANKSGAAWGSRHGITEAVTNAESARQAGDLSAQIRRGGWDNAVSIAQGEKDRGIQTGVANQNAALGNAASLRSTAATMGSLGQGAQGAALQDASSLFETGSQLQQQGQRELDADYNSWYDKTRGWPLQQFSTLQQILSGVPHGQSQTNVSPTYSNPFMQMAGGALTGINIASKMGATTTGGLGMGGVAGGLLAFSDETMKTDIEPTGKTLPSGAELFAYRFRDDDKRAPKTVGVIAQRVKKTHPHAVRRVSGKLAVDYRKIA